MQVGVLMDDWWSLTDGGGSSRQGGFGSLVEVVTRDQAFLRSLEVGVGINASRDHQLTVRIQRLHTRWDNQVLAYLPVRKQEVWSCQRSSH